MTAITESPAGASQTVILATDSNHSPTSSPIESLAPELLLNIFKEASSSPYVVNKFDSPPWVLTFVNKKWRAVAQSCSSLWSNFIVDVSPDNSFDPRLLELAISRTSGHPLNVYWKSQGEIQDVSDPSSRFLTVFQTFLRTSPSWRSVTYEFHSSFLNSLIPLSYHLDILEEMRIILSDNHVRDIQSDPVYYEIDGTNLSVMVCSAQRLQHFTQWGGPVFFPIFEHLTEYSLQYDIACGLQVFGFLQYVLTTSQWLEKLTIRRNAFLAYESLPGHVVHPVVTHTTLRHLDTDDPIILMASNLPHLEELKFNFHIAFSMPCIIPAIGRSRTTLTSISMSIIHLFRLDTDAFIAAMHSCHNLRTIEIKEEPEIIVVGLHAMPEPLSDVETDGAVAVLRSFTPSHDGAVPCPHLETFKLEIHCYPCVESNLIASRKSQLANAALLMIQNRRTVDSTVKQVQIGVIYRDGWPVNLIEEYGSLSSILTDHGPVTNADLRNWKSSGLSLEFRWHRTLYTY